MNSIKDYFASPSKSVPSSVESKIIPNNGNGEVVDLIILNMEDVLLKNKHKKKKKRKKTDGKNETEISDISNSLTNSLCFVSPILEKTTPRKENKSKKTEEVKKTLSTKKTIEGFFKKTPPPSNHPPTPEKVKETKNKENSNSSLNAFTLMMSSRNKSIGSNEDGIEISLNECETMKNLEKAKRKLMLESWADKKGGIKKKIQEKERDEIIQIKMDKRAERLKSLVTQQNFESGSDNDDGQVVKRKRGRPKKTTESNMEVKPKVVKKRIIRLISTDNESDKTESPLKNSSTTKTPKRRKSNLSEDESVLTTSSRPKRSCVGKNVRYDDYELSPEKKKKFKKNKDEDHEVIELISDDSSTPKKMIPKKLASLFIKKLPKPTVDPEILKARQNFLMSGIPERLKVEIEKQKIYEESLGLDDFPTVTHITQSDGIFVLNDIDLKSIKVSDEIICDLADPKTKDLKYGELTDCSLDNYWNILKRLKNPVACKTSIELMPVLENLKDFVKSLKPFYTNFPIYRSFKQLRSQKLEAESEDFEELHVIKENEILQTSSVKKKSGRSRKSGLDESVEIIEVKSNQTSINGYQLFTEKYKPFTSDNIIVNFLPVLDLKKFLLNWQQDDKPNYDDYESGNDSNCSTSIGKNFMVLVGPNGSGKTNSVYALANEMNFKVLEINAGAKRTGKKILQELQEATQSHQVRTQKDKKDYFKKSLKKLKRSDSTDSCSSGSQETTKKSLILIEDADIVFDQDDGFISAISQLVSSSKRPVILIANNLNCPHLTKLIFQNSIIFQEPNSVNISKWLSIVSLVENVFIDYSDIVKLYLFNNSDLRRTILELQLFIQSGGDHDDGCRSKTDAISLTKNFTCTSELFEMLADDDSSKSSWIDDKNDKSNDKNYKHKNLFNFYTKDQNHESLINFPVDLDVVQCNSTVFLKESKALDDILNFYENMSCCNFFQNSTSDDRTSNQLNEEIVHEIVEINLKGFVKKQSEINILKKNDTNSRDILYNNIYSSCLDSRSIYLDYEPNLREICRSEKIRSKKEGRFYHYLRNMAINNIGNEMFAEFSCVFEENTIQLS